MTQPNNRYDRDLPLNFIDAENAKNRNEALNVLGLISQRDHMRKVRREAIRAQYIQPNELTG